LLPDLRIILTLGHPIACMVSVHGSQLREVGAWTSQGADILPWVFY